MTCREFTEFLMDYLDGALPAGNAQRFEEHLAECAECRTYLDTYRETKRLVADEGRNEVPPEVPEDLVKAILDSRKA